MPDGMISHRFVGHAIPYISFVTPKVGGTLQGGVSSENGAYICIMHLVVHTYDYIRCVCLSMSHVSTTLYKLFHGFFYT